MSVCLSARPSASNNSAPNGQIFMKFNIRVFFKNFRESSRFIKIFTRIREALHEYLWTFLITSRSVFLRMKTFSDRSNKMSSSNISLELRGSFETSDICARYSPVRPRLLCECRERLKTSQVQCISTYILRYTNTFASVVPCHVINMFILTFPFSCTDITTAGRNLYLHNPIIELWKCVPIIKTNEMH